MLHFAIDAMPVHICYTVDIHDINDTNRVFCIKLYSVATGIMIGLCRAVGLYRCSTKGLSG